MSMQMPQVPVGNGKHPIRLVVISANDLPASALFYAKVFGWQTHPLSAELTAVVPPSGPGVALRAGVPPGFPGVVPYLGVADVQAALADATAAGGAVERAPWLVPMVGKLARFKDPSGTIYGLTEAIAPGEETPVPAPFGSNPKPMAGSICSLEMFAAAEAPTAPFFEGLFGWGTIPTMPQYVMFDPGVGIGGVFQSHTPAKPALGYIYTADVRAKLEELERAGGRRLGDAMSMPGMACFGYFTDPSGTDMGLIGPS